MRARLFQNEVLRIAAKEKTDGAQTVETVIYGAAYHLREAAKDVRADNPMRFVALLVKNLRSATLAASLIRLTAPNAPGGKISRTEVDLSECEFNEKDDQIVVPAEEASDNLVIAGSPDEASYIGTLVIREEFEAFKLFADEPDQKQNKLN